MPRRTLARNTLAIIHVYLARSPENFCGFFLRTCLGILHWKAPGIFGEFFLVSVSHETKHENSSKNSGKIRSKIRAKFGTKIRKIRGTFVLQVFWPNTCVTFCVNGSLRGQSCKRKIRGPWPHAYQTFLRGTLVMVIVLLLLRSRFWEDHDHMCSTSFERKSWSWSSFFLSQIMQTILNTPTPPY